MRSFHKVSIEMENMHKLQFIETFEDIDVGVLISSLEAKAIER